MHSLSKAKAAIKTLFSSQAKAKVITSYATWIRHRDDKF